MLKSVSPRWTTWIVTVLSRYLRDLSARLEALGARRVHKAGGYYWILKPGLKPGEDISL